MAGYVGNLISYHDRRKGELSAFGVREPEQILMGPGPDVMQGSRADRWARRQARHRSGASGRFRHLAAVLPRDRHVKYKGQRVYYDKSSHS